MQPSPLPKSQDQFNRVIQNVRALQLSPQQLNAKPNAKTWSVGEILQHLMRVHDQYRPRLEPLLDPKHRPGTAARWGIGAGFFGKMLKGVTHPKAKKKTKTLGQFEPTRSHFDTTIIEQFVAHSTAFQRLLAAIPEARYNENISSPAGTWVVLPVHDVIELLGNHMERHWNQLETVV